LKSKAVAAMRAVGALSRENGTMSIKHQLQALTDLRPRLTVVGVGGAGCNAINNMIAAGLQGVDFIVANTDAQALASSSAEHRIQLGVALTEGLGAGSKPEIGEAAAEEAIEDLRAQIVGSNMVFIAAGMGGGTGTGAAAVIARVARELGILTVGIVTKPFHFEGTRRMRIADIGIAEIKRYVDTLIVIPNQNLFRVANEKTTFAEAFILADQVLYSGVACIVDLIIKEGLINLDFADVRTVMSGMGTAMMGTGEASGERRAIMAAEEAIANPLLDDVSLRGARGLLLSISGGRDLTLYEVDEAASRVREEVDPEANIIVGATFDDSLGDRVRVSIVASGMMRQGEQQPDPYQARPQPEPQPQPPSPPPVAFPSAPAASLAPPPTPARVQPPVAAAVPTAPPPRAVESPDQHDIQRRLSAALRSDEPADPFAAVQWAQTSTAAAPTPPPPQVPKVEPSPADSPRGLWQAPGSVLIEEAPPVVTRRAEVPRSATPAPYPETFTPELPTEIRRPQRRMPEVEDFPAVAQREYRAKAPTAKDAEPTQAKRPGLFERLGMARKGDDSHTVSMTAPPASRDLRPQRTPDTRNRGPAVYDRPASSASDVPSQGIENTDVYKRDRK
jgi:cell division protein FtsZ